MKKLITILFSVGLVTAAFAQSGYRDRGNSQTTLYSNNYNQGYSNQYSSGYGNSQWNGRGYDNRFERARERRERERYERMMRERQMRRYYERGRYGNDYGYRQSRPVIQFRIGIGGRSRY
jgi:hypothetical protein